MQAKFTTTKSPWLHITALSSHKYLTVKGEIKYVNKH